MQKRTIALGLRKYNYVSLYLFGKTIHAGIQNHAALFPSPVPSLAVFQSSINRMKTATENWGERGSVGGTKEKAALVDARDILREHLKSLARYLMMALPGNFQSWLVLGI